MTQGRFLVPVSSSWLSDAVSGLRTSIMRTLLELLESDDGATAVEYAVMLVLIIVACFASITLLVNATADSCEDSAERISKSLGS